MNLLKKVRAHLCARPSREKRNEFDSVSAGTSENFNGAAALRIEASMIGDQADMLASERSKSQRFEYVNAGLDTSGTARFCGRGVERNQKSR
jgi:hypothetical protein